MVTSNMMGVGTKQRHQQNADACKDHLREKHNNQRALVSEFIVEFEGIGKNHDMTRWSQFADIRDVKAEMLERLDAHFESWLHP